MGERMYRWLVVSSLICTCAGCVGSMDVLGHDLQIMMYDQYESDPDPGDDRVDEKHPEYDPQLISQEIMERCVFWINKSGSLVRLLPVPFEEKQQHLEGVFFKTRRECVNQVAQAQTPFFIPSLHLVAGLAATYKESIDAAVQMALQEGVGALRGKRRFLLDLVTRLNEMYAFGTPTSRPHLEKALVFAAGGLLASGNGGHPELNELDPQLLDLAQDEVVAFLADPLRSTIKGIYERNDLLGEVFLQDRFLANTGSTEDSSLEQFGLFAALAEAISSDATLLAEYTTYMDIGAGLFDGYTSHSPRSLLPYVEGVDELEDVESLRQTFLATNDLPYTCSGTYLALLPLSSAPESKYYSQSYCSSPPQPGTDPLSTFVEALGNGSFDSAPRTSSGFDAYRGFALAPYHDLDLGPQYDSLLLTRAFRLRELHPVERVTYEIKDEHAFKREAISDPEEKDPVKTDIFPLLHVEPFPLYYLRTARAFRFLTSHLDRTMGADLLGEIHRLMNDDTSSSDPLSQDVESFTRLLYGLFMLASRSVGTEPWDLLNDSEAAAVNPEQGAVDAAGFLSGWTADPDVLDDGRSLVPVGIDHDGQKMIYFATLGFKVMRVQATFVDEFGPRDVAPVFPEECEIGYTFGQSYTLLIEDVRAIRVPLSRAPLTNEAYREICDGQDDPDAIVSMLEAE